MSSIRVTRGALAALVMLAGLAAEGSAQERRRSADGAPPPPPAGTVTHPRYPAAGVWEGTRRNPSGEESPATLMFEVSDSTKQQYRGAQMMSDGGRVPFPDVSWSAGTLRWKSPNSGGGDWMYTGRLSGTDTLKVEMVLKGAPWNPSPEPKMTYVLARKAPGR